jgi:hypothetical protein
MPPEEAIAICFCGPAKTTGLGIPLLYAMWTPVDLFTKAQTSVPVLLYTTEQICVAHFMVYVFRHWKNRLKQQKGDLEESVTDADAENEGEQRPAGPSNDGTDDTNTIADNDDHIVLEKKDATGTSVLPHSDEEHKEKQESEKPDS